MNFALSFAAVLVLLVGQATPAKFDRNESLNQDGDGIGEELPSPEVGQSKWGHRAAQ